MAINKAMFWICCWTIALMMSVALVDAQTFFQNGRFGKRASDLRLRVASRAAGDDRFFGGPRFGRSGHGIAPSANEMEARNTERFFIGSRYGKRSEVDQIVPPLSVEDASAGSQEKEFILECIPISADQLYHCERKSSSMKTQEEA